MRLGDGEAGELLGWKMVRLGDVRLGDGEAER